MSKTDTRKLDVATPHEDRLLYKCGPKRIFFFLSFIYLFSKLILEIIIFLRLYFEMQLESHSYKLHLQQQGTGYLIFLKFNAILH